MINRISATRRKYRSHIWRGQSGSPVGHLYYDSARYLFYRLFKALPCSRNSLWSVVSLRINASLLQTSYSSWQFLILGNERIKTVPNDSYGRIWHDTILTAYVIGPWRGKLVTPFKFCRVGPARWWYDALRPLLRIVSFLPASWPGQRSSVEVTSKFRPSHLPWWQLTSFPVSGQ